MYLLKMSAAQEDNLLDEINSIYFILFRGIWLEEL